jgi:alanine racemase
MNWTGNPGWKFPDATCPISERYVVRVDLKAIHHNTRVLLRYAAGAALWPVVKANGYGHGAIPVASAALEAGAQAVCVATVDEAAELRKHLRHSRIIVLGPVLPTRFRDARAMGVELVASCTPLPEGIPVHVKLDTGMGRWGFSEMPSATRDVVAVMSHFATADSIRSFARQQLGSFHELTAGVPLLRHVANSAALLTMPESTLEAVRPGIALYGVDPFGRDASRFDLRPALTWRSHIALVKTLPAGHAIGYGQAFITPRRMRIGLVPVGYADGFMRSANDARVIVDDRRRRVLGRVSMDAFAVEVTADTQVGAPVTLIGPGAAVEELARTMKTIPNEVLTGIAARPPRARVVYERAVPPCTGVGSTAPP